MKYIREYIALTLIIAISASVTGCAFSANASDLMDGIYPDKVNGKRVDSVFIESMSAFSIDLFKMSIDEKENALISPMSVMLALAMTANGADNNTLAQMERLLGRDIPVEQLNEYLYSYVDDLPSSDRSMLKTANSIWFRDDNTLKVNPVFLQTNADYFGAQLFSAPFNNKTVAEINNWVNTQTDGMINRIIEGIEDVAMLLINAVTFDAEWQTKYNEYTVREGVFTDIIGNKQNVDFMYSAESLFLDDGLATGFLKPYFGGHYSFVALLPNADVPITSYIESLTGDGFLRTLRTRQSATVHASMPKFEYEFSAKMNDALKALGITDAFDVNRADFHKMATSSIDNLILGEVLHKTFISVDERGTRAGAVTVVPVAPGSAQKPDEPKIVHLDRPFVFAIIDNSTKLPVFIGTLMSVNEMPIPK